VAGPDDYASMAEVLTRRFLHGLDEQKEGAEDNGSFTRFPDLIMMDGGRGQVNIALSVLKKLELSIPVCGMVKDDNHRTRGVFFQNIEIPIDHFSEGFQLVTRIQDEAHRFAIEYHRSLRSKGQVHSILDDIETIGPTRRRALMKYFRGIEELRAADVETLKAVPSMNESAAKKVWDFFHLEKTESEGKADADNTTEHDEYSGQE
jgi:excinuclease ABC subunit C